MNNNQFNYTYSAPTEDERKEIESIRSRYETKTESKLDKLRRIDAKIKGVTTAVALILGVLGCLIFGTGITCFLEWERYLLGSLLGTIGIVLMAISFPVYNLVMSYYKKKYTAEILRLSDELLDKSNSEK